MALPPTCKAGDFFKPTFTDWNAFRSVADDICAACAFTMNEADTELQARIGKDVPQRFRNYSHFVLNGQHLIFSKGQKAQMCKILRMQVPEVAVIADSGQKHLCFKARVNPAGQRMGWVMLEEEHVWLTVVEFCALQDVIGSMYAAGFSKDGILSGRYKFYPDSDMRVYRQHEPLLARWRGTALFALAVHLTTKGTDDDSNGSPIDGD